MKRILFEGLSLFIMISGYILCMGGNPLNSVLFRILIFVLSTLIRFTLGLEYLARRIRIIYVGAIAILFRFVVMIVNLSELSLEEEISKKKDKGLFKLGLGLGLVGRFIMKVLYVDYYVYTNTLEGYLTHYFEWYKSLDEVLGIHMMGQVLYKNGFERLLVMGRFLRVGRFGALGLTMKVKADQSLKLQDVDAQISRSSDKARFLVSNIDKGKKYKLGIEVKDKEKEGEGFLEKGNK